MNRRDFLMQALQLSAAGLLVPPFLRRGTLLGFDQGLALASDATIPPDFPLAGRILVLINLEGGNDSLNTVIPMTDPLYYERRPNIAIPPIQVVPVSPITGLHPALAPLAPIYNQGRMAILQGVGYEDMNLSHFRGTDIWFSGSGSEEYLETGWLARFLEAMFPDFPAWLPQAPYGVQQSFGHRIPLQGDRGLTGVVVDNPYSFYSLVLSSYAGDWNDEPPDTRGGEELDFVRKIDRETFQYAEAIQTAADAGQNTVTYPFSQLGLQLEVVARVISGGLRTPIYLTALGGFDTHTDQSEQHADILDDLGRSVALFLQDLANQNLDDRVLIMTTSEFGRRVEENGGWGTDHGTVVAQLIMGQPVQGGLYGVNPNLADLDPNDNMLVQQDFRSVYATVMKDFYGASDAVVGSVLQGSFPTLGFISSQPTELPNPRALPLADRLHGAYPNPLSASKVGRTTVRFELAHPSQVSLEAFDAQGRRILDLGAGSYREGRHEVAWDLSRLPAGTYLIRLRTPSWEKKSKLVVLP